MAQTAVTTSGELEEIIVTAEFRSVDIQKTPINLTVVSQEDMLEKGIADTRTMLDSRSGQDVYATEVNVKTDAGALTVLAARVNTNIDYSTYTNGLRFGNFSDVYQNSLEVRFAGDSFNRLNWLVGAFYFKEHQDAFQFNMQNTGYALLVTPNLTDESYAAFGDETSLSLNASVYRLDCAIPTKLRSKMAMSRRPACH